MLAELRADARRLREFKRRGFPWYVLESLLFENGYQAVVLYRFGHWFKRRGIPLFGPACARLALLLTGADIAPGAEIGPGLLIAHGSGLVIGDRVRIGAGATLLHQVTLGAPSVERKEEMPVLGDGVFVAAGAYVIGGVRVGDGAFVGAKAMVTRDVPAGARVVAEIPVRVIPGEAPAADAG